MTAHRYSIEERGPLQWAVVESLIYETNAPPNVVWWARSAFEALCVATALREDPKLGDLLLPTNRESRLL